MQADELKGLPTQTSNKRAMWWKAVGFADTSHAVVGPEESEMFSFL